MQQVEFKYKTNDIFLVSYCNQYELWKYETRQAYKIQQEIQHGQKNNKTMYIWPHTKAFHKQIHEHFNDKLSLNASCYLKRKISKLAFYTNSQLFTQKSNKIDNLPLLISFAVVLDSFWRFLRQKFGNFRQNPSPGRTWKIVAEGCDVLWHVTKVTSWSLRVCFLINPLYTEKKFAHRKNSEKKYRAQQTYWKKKSSKNYGWFLKS